MSMGETMKISHLSYSTKAYSYKQMLLLRRIFFTSSKHSEYIYSV